MPDQNELGNHRAYTKLRPLFDLKLEGQREVIRHALASYGVEHQVSKNSIRLNDDDPPRVGPVSPREIPGGGSLQWTNAESVALGCRTTGNNQTLTIASSIASYL